MDDENRRNALDYLRYMVLKDPCFQLADPKLRVAALHVATRLAAIAKISLPSDLDDDAILLLRMADIHGNQRKPVSMLLPAFVRSNPMLLSMVELMQRFAPQEPPAFANTTRHSPRTNRLQQEKRQFSPLALIGPNPPRASNPKRARLLRGKAHPMDPETCHYYHEVVGEDHPHSRSPWYMFHAWAWGRRRYAAWLEANGHVVCPLSGLTLRTLLASNPESGDGSAWVALASDYATRLQHKHAATIALPIPALGINAHLINNTPFTNLLHQGTAFKDFMVALNDEREGWGMDRFRPGKQREL